MIPTKFPTIFLAFELTGCTHNVRKYHQFMDTLIKGPLITRDEYLSLIIDDKSTISTEYYPEFLN